MIHVRMMTTLLCLQIRAKNQLRVNGLSFLLYFGSFFTVLGGMLLGRAHTSWHIIFYISEILVFLKWNILGTWWRNIRSQFPVRDPECLGRGGSAGSRTILWYFGIPNYPLTFQDPQLSSDISGSWTIIWHFWIPNYPLTFQDPALSSFFSGFRNILFTFHRILNSPLTFQDRLTQLLKTLLDMAVCFVGNWTKNFLFFYLLVAEVKNLKQWLDTEIPVRKSVILWIWIKKLMCLMCVTFPVLLAVLLGLVIAFDFAALMIPAGFFVFARYCHVVILPYHFHCRKVFVVVN